MKAAITGTGFMGVTHAEALRRLGVDVIGILGSTPEKSEQAAKQLDIPRAYDDLDALLADPDVTVVHITTPNRHHFESAKAAIKAGKHVLCEKPLAMNTQESAILVQMAEEHKTCAAVNYNIRFYPLCLEAKQRVADGSVGTIHSVTGAYEQDWLLEESDYNWRVLASEGGALRAVADIGTHWLDLTQSITQQKVTAVFADLHTIHPTRTKPAGEVETFSSKLSQEQATERIPIDTEDMGSLLLRFENGAKGCLFVSQVVAGKKNGLRFEIAGSKQTLAWDSESPNQLHVGHRAKANETLAKDPSLLSPSARAFVGYPGGHNEGYPDSFKMCFKSFYDYLESGGNSGALPFPSFADGHREIELCEAVLESHRTERWVNL